ncbi:hypothetical protein [Pseudonocardia sp.]
MPILDKIKNFMRSPQGRKLADQGRRYASDPKNQEKLRRLMNKRRGG